MPDAAKYRWVRIAVPGHSGEAGTPPDPQALAHISIPADFVREVNAILTPGATVLVTGQALSPATTGHAIQIVDADPPPGETAPHL